MSANGQREALKLISHLLEDPYNQICADCQCKPSKWASTTLGVFICIDCSGVHRSLGTHISFVRSCTLDSWTMEQARLMEAIGNRLGNSYWESKLPMDYERPGNSNRSLMQNFIKEKYQLKRYADDGPPPHIVYKHLLMKQMASSSISSSHGKRSRSEKHHSRSMKNSQSYDNTKNFDDKHKDLQFSRPQNQTPPAQEAPPPQIEHESLDSFFAEQPKRSIPKPYIPHKKVVYEMPKEEPDYENMRPDEIDSFFNTESIENAMLSKMQNMFAGKIGGNNDQEPEQEVEYDAFGEIAEPNTAKLESFFDGKPSPQQNSTTSPQKLQNHSSLVITNISTAQIPQNQQNCDLNDNNENDITNENFDQNIEENDEENPENECFEEEEEINNVNEPLTNEPNQIEIPQKIENHLNDELITEQQVEAPVFPTLGDIKITLDIPNEDNSLNAAANDDDGFWDDVANDENEDDGFFELPPKTNLPEPIKLEGKSIQPTTDLLNQVQPTAIQEDKLFDLSLSQNAPLPNLEQNEYVSMDNNTEANITRNEYDAFKEKQNVNNHLLDDYNSMNNNDVNLIENSNPPQAQLDIDTSLLDTTNPFEQTENENSNNLENILNNASTKTNNDTFEINFECDNKNNDQVYENKENEINKQNSSQELIPENFIEDNSNLPNNDNDEMIETNRNNSLEISAQSSNVEPNAITQINDNNHNVDFHEEPVEKIVVRESSQKKVIRLSINMVNAIDLTEPELKPRKAETIEEQIIDDFFAEAEQTLSQKPKPNIHSRSHHSRPTNTNPSNTTTTNVSNEPMEENTNKSRRRHHRDDDEYEDFFQPKQRTKSQTPPDVAVSRTQKSAFAPPPARKPGAHLPARLQKKIEPVVEESSRRRRHHHSKK